MVNFEVPIIDGDLFTYKSDMIVQQCNCLTCRALGLAKDIADKYQVNSYQHRKCLYNNANCAIKEDRQTVGNIKIYRLKNKNTNYIACLFSQFAPGRPNHYYSNILAEHIDPLTQKSLIETKETREIWFKLCLKKLAIQIKHLKCQIIAFPYAIGCGLAGGDWSNYYQMINEWAESHKDIFNVVILKKS